MKIERGISISEKNSLVISHISSMHSLINIDIIILAMAYVPMRAGKVRAGVCADGV
jgi:hypothetical protein